MTKPDCLLILGFCLFFAACGNHGHDPVDDNFFDSVTEALSNDGNIDLNRLQWTREPQAFEVNDGTITITTAPHTDLWQRTYYHFRNDNAPVLQMKTREQYFSFVVKTDFTQSHQRFDQCGIVMYLDSENWLKGSVEFENGEFQHLGSVATNHGYSDWATTAIPADVKLCGIVSHDGLMTTASNAQPMASISAKCVFAICMLLPTKSASAFTPAHLRSPHSLPFSPI